MSQTAKQSQDDVEAMSSKLNLPIVFDHAAGSSMDGSRKLTDIEARIEEEDDDSAAALEHDEESQEDDDVNTAANNEAVKTNYPRG
jgi:hypothetical protein